MPTKEQIEFDLRMGVMFLSKNKRYTTRYPLSGPLTPYETPDSRATRVRKRREAAARDRILHKDNYRKQHRRWTSLHPEVKRENNRRYRVKHRNELRKKDAEYQKTRRTERRLNGAVYRATHKTEIACRRRLQVAGPADWYVSQLFRRGTTLTSADVPPEIIVSVRSVLNAKRALRSIRNPETVQLHDPR